MANPVENDDLQNLKGVFDRVNDSIHYTNVVDYEYPSSSKDNDILIVADPYRDINTTYPKVLNEFRTLDVTTVTQMKTASKVLFKNPDSGNLEVVFAMYIKDGSNWKQFYQLEDIILG